MEFNCSLLYTHYARFPSVSWSQFLHLHSSRVLPVDLSDPEATRASVDKAMKLIGKVDMLVNNAGTKVDRGGGACN